ncbi:MAG: hypothetical protein ABJ251_04840 [Paracoccaceae bacterium]
MDLNSFSKGLCLPMQNARPDEISRVLAQAIGIIASDQTPITTGHKKITNAMDLAFCPTDVANQMDVQHANVKEALCSMTISVPPPDSAIITTATTATIPKKTIANRLAKTAENH